MTVIAIHKGKLYTDSLILEQIDACQSHVVKIQEKVIKDPNNKWIYVESGYKPQEHSWKMYGVEKLAAAAYEWYDVHEKTNVAALTLYKMADIDTENIKAYNGGAFITKDYAWVPDISEDSPIATSELFWLAGSGMFALNGFFSIHGNMRKAMKEVLQFPQLAIGGPMREYDPPL